MRALIVIVTALIVVSCSSDKPSEPPMGELPGVVLNLNPDESLTWTCPEHKIPMAVWDPIFVAGDTVWCARGDRYRIKWIKWVGVERVGRGPFLFAIINLKSER